MSPLVYGVVVGAVIFAAWVLLVWYVLTIPTCPCDTTDPEPSEPVRTFQPKEWWL